MTDKNKTNSYNQSSIKKLEGPEQVRSAPAVIFGTNDEYGAAHALMEIIANSVDEVREGYGDRVTVIMKQDGEITVKDKGRGVPLDWNDKVGQFNWELVFCTLYASGKYDSKAYKSALGTYGLGASSTQFGSEYMTVISKNETTISKISFKKGFAVTDLIKEPNTTGETGTEITFKLDLDVFEGTTKNVLEPEYYVSIFRKHAMLAPGLTFEFIYEGIDKPLLICYDSLQDFIDTACDGGMIDNAMLFTGSDTGYDSEKNKEPYEVKMRISFNFSKEVSLLEVYHNGGEMVDGGVTLDAIKTGFIQAFEQYAKETGKLPKGEKFNFKDIEQILVAVGDTQAPGNRTYFKYQTKTAINNPFIKRVYTDFILRNVLNWLRSDKQSENVVKAVIDNKTTREEMDKVAKNLIQQLKKPVTFGNRPKKFIDCKVKDKSLRELYIVEGDSALGGCRLAREEKIQALLALRGKILYCLKEDVSRIYSSEIILQLIRILGCGVELKSKYIENLPEFEIEKLNYARIILCTDADIDGMQIRCLILAFIYRVCPTLLRENKVFIAETPLFEISFKGKKESAFAYTIEEKDEMIKKLEDANVDMKKVKVQRSKGLGENTREMLHKTTMDPKTRRLTPIESDESKEEFIAKYFNALLGDDIISRKIIINKYFESTEMVE